MVHCNNEAVVNMWKKGTIHCPKVMALFACFIFVQNSITCTHVAIPSLMLSPVFRFTVSINLLWEQPPTRTLSVHGLEGLLSTINLEELLSPPGEHIMPKSEPYSSFVLSMQ